MNDSEARNDEPSWKVLVRISGACFMIVANRIPRTVTDDTIAPVALTSLTRFFANLTTSG